MVTGRDVTNTMVTRTICIILSIIQMTSSAMQPYSTSLETELRKALFTDYEILQRPSEQLAVQVSFNLITINGLDIKDQVLSTSGFFTMKWQDGRLNWANNASTYGNIRFIFSNEDYTWRPSIVVENSWSDSRLYWENNSRYKNIRFIFSNENVAWRPAVVVENSVENLAVFSDVNTLIRVVSTGTAFWTPGGIFQTSCDADVTYYPLDTQTCSIVLTTWAYTSNEVKLELDTQAIITDNFSPNGEWDVVETEATTETAEKRFDSNSYDRIYFTFKLKRRPLFHILNTILPVLLMASLIVFVFKLPPESGERVGMSLTVLLAYAVYLTLISENIPQTSLSASILSTYLTIILMLSTLSVIFTIVVLDIYFNHSDDEEPPKFIQALTRVVLVRLAMWKGQGCCKKRKVDNYEGPGEALPGDKLGRPSTIMVKPPLTDDSRIETPDDDVKQYSWKEVALILDRCFMYLFIFAVVVCTVVCLAILACGGS